MKIKALLVLCILFFRPHPVCSWDFTVSGGADYESFSLDTESKVGRFFTPKLVPVYSAEFKDDFAIEYDYKFRAEYDPIWRYVFSGDVGYSFENMTAGLGFFVSDFDMEFLDLAVGLSGRAGFEFPGVFFANAGVASSLSGDYGKAGTSSRRLFNGKFGFWLPHLFITFDFEAKEFTRKITETFDIRTSRTRYKSSIEIYSKNVPYRLRLDFGWRKMERSMTDGYVIEYAPTEDFFAGAGFRAQASKIFAWFVEGEILLNMINSRNSPIYYRAEAGVTFSYPEK